jgi:hypothetical protein
MKTKMPNAGEPTEHSARSPGVRRWQDDAVAYVAVVVALMALGVSIWQGVLTRQHNRLTVLPVLFAYADFTLGTEESGLFLANRGGGPAILNSSMVSLKGKKAQHMTHDGWQAVLRDGGMSLKAATISWRFEPGAVVDAHDPILLLRLDKGGTVDELKELKQFVQKDLRVELCYCSLYDECRRMIYADDRTTIVPASCPHDSIDMQ